MSSGNWKLALTLFVVVVVAYYAVKIALGVFAAVMGLLTLLVPFAIVAVVAYVLYSIISKKPLGGGRRTLP